MPKSNTKNHGANTNKVLEYIDFASKHGFNGLLVEGWNKGWYPAWCCSGNGIPFSFTETQEDFDTYAKNFKAEFN